MRSIEIDGVTVTIEPRELPPHDFGGRGCGRKKGPIRLVCEALRPGESAFLPVSTDAIQSANLYGIGKAVGGKFHYRSEGKGVRIYRAAEAKPKNLRGWNLRAA